MDAREQFTQLLAWVIKSSDEVESSQIQADITLLIGAAGQLVGKMAERNTALAKQCRKRKVKPPKPNPQKGPQQGNSADSGTGKQDGEAEAEDRSKELSAIQQGIRRADPTLADQQRALRQQIYGPQNRDLAFAKAAKAIAS